MVYNIALGYERQLFQVEVFIFFPTELGSVEAGFYHNLWQVVRLHTPQVTLSVWKGVCLRQELSSFSDSPCLILRAVACYRPQWLR